MIATHGNGNYSETEGENTSASSLGMRRLDHVEAMEGRRAGGQEGRRAGGQEGRRAGGQQSRRAGGQEGRRAGGQEGRRAGGQEGRRAGGQEGRRAGVQTQARSIVGCVFIPTRQLVSSSFHSKFRIDLDYCVYGEALHYICVSLFEATNQIDNC